MFFRIRYWLDLLNLSIIQRHCKAPGNTASLVTGAHLQDGVGLPTKGANLQDSKAG
jgi:hypothetical protein